MEREAIKPFVSPNSLSKISPREKVIHEELNNTEGSRSMGNLLSESMSQMIN